MLILKITRRKLTDDYWKKKVVKKLGPQQN